MDRLIAKVKVSTLLANYLRAPRGKKLPSGTVDRVTDQMLADPGAVADLADLDPNDDFSASAFVARNRDLFRVAPRTPKVDSYAGKVRASEDLALVAARARNAAIDAARDAYARALAPDPAPAPELLAEDVLSLIGSTPVILNDLIGALRGSMRSPMSLESDRRWRNVRTGDVEGLLREYGAYLMCRDHGAGLAVYVASAPFETVVDRWGKSRDVREY
jgi:hypothetical protein